MTPSSNPRGVSHSLAIVALATSLFAGVSTVAKADWRGPVIVETWSDTVVILPPRPLPYPHHVLVEPPEEVIVYDEAPLVDEAIIVPPDFDVEDDWLGEAVPPRVVKPRRGIEEVRLPGDDGPRVVPSLAPSVAPKKPAKPRVVTVNAALTLPVPRPNLEGIDAAGPLVPVAATGAPAGNR